MALAGFETYTHELTEKEIDLAFLMADGFKRRVGKENAISSTEIIKSMKAKGYSISGPRVRKIVNFLVNTKLVHKWFIADESGYYIATKEEEVERHVLSLVQRGASIIQRAKTYECFAKVAMGVEQLKIFAQ